MKFFYVVILLVLTSLGMIINSYADEYPGEYLIQNVESGLSLVPYRETVHQNFGKLCVYKIKNNKSVSDQRWYIVGTGNGVLIKNVESGLSLVPYRETVYKNFGKLCLYNVIGTGIHDQRWRFFKTENGILIRNVESGLSLVPYRETVYKNFGKLCIFSVNNAQAVPDQKWRLVKVK